MNWAKRRIPEFAPLPYENQRLIVEIARQKAVYAYREQLGLIVRFIAGPVVGYAIVFLTIHELRWHRHSSQDRPAFAVVILFYGCVIASGIIGMRYRRDLLLPRIRAQLTGVCPTCGYNLAGITSAKCPECGASIAINSAQSVTALDAPPFTATSGSVTGVDSLCRSFDWVARYQLNVLTPLAQAGESAGRFVRNINEVVLRWVRFRGEACQRVQFAFRGIQPQQQAELVSLVLRILKQDIPERSILERLVVELRVEDDEGNELATMGLAAGQ